MTAFFTWTGFICAMLLLLALTLYLLACLLALLFGKMTQPMRVFRFVWRFYKSLPNSKFNRECRYWIALYDKDVGKFVKTVAINRDFQTEEEYDEMIAEFKREHTRKGGGVQDGVTTVS